MMSPQGVAGQPGNRKIALFAMFDCTCLTDNDTSLIELQINKKKMHGCDPYPKEND